MDVVGGIGALDESPEPEPGVGAAASLAEAAAGRAVA